jgi:hypothetical protein
LNDQGKCAAILPETLLRCVKGTSSANTSCGFF